jgi:hypothetical protein
MITASGPQNSDFRGPRFSTVTGWNRLRSEQIFLLRRGTGFESISLQRGVMRTLSPSECSGIGGRVHKGLPTNTGFKYG